MTSAIVDAHHHIWRLADLPWLHGPTLPRIFGPYEAIRRDYTIDEFRAEATAAGVQRSVYVQCNWPNDRAVDEVAWVSSQATRTGWPHAIVGFVDLLDDGAPAVIGALGKFPLMRGVRQQLHWHANELYRFAPRPDLAEDPKFRRNLALVAERGWLFELQVFASQMECGAKLARDMPGVTFVLEHAGMLEDTSDAGRRLWRDGMQRLAAEPNVHVKLSGLGTFLRRNDPAHVADIVSQTVEIFGPERCVWGSNFPVEKLWTDYASIVAALRAAITPLEPAAQRQILSQTATRLYRLDLMGA